MASIRKRKNSYQISVFLGRDATGKKIISSTTYTPTSTTPRAIQKEVENFALLYEQRAKQDGGIIKKDIFFTDIIAAWKTSPAYKNLTLSCQDDYMDIITRRLLPTLKTLKISAITPRHIQEIYAHLEEEKRAPKTILRTHTVLNSLMTYAHKSGYISENPCTRVYLPRLTHDTAIHYLTAEQAISFLDFISAPITLTKPAIVRKNGRIIPAHTDTIEASSMWTAFFYLAIYGGFRRGELCALTWEHIDFDDETVSIASAIAKTKHHGLITKAPKTTAGTRTISLPPVCFEKLHIWKQEQLRLALRPDWKGHTGKEFDKNYLFIQENGLKLYVDTPTKKFKKLLLLYNKKFPDEPLPLIHLHDLRHTSATLMLANRVDIETVSHRLGHSKPSITLDIYGHWMEETDRAAADTLDKLLTMKKRQKL